MLGRWLWYVEVHPWRCVSWADYFQMSKYAIPEMRKNEGQWRGSIVNIASVAGIRGGNPHLLYPTSKGAVVVRNINLQSVSALLTCLIL
jgi:NAD(P)-dependent dehydrogenase (short-subunit alcohol dehydrogenase family)